MIFGTFDGIHDGHRNLFGQASAHGDFLSVVVARDATVVEIKGRPPRFGEGERMTDLMKEHLIDDVILGNLSDKFEVVRKQRPDVICLGYDQKNFVEDLQKKLDAEGLSETKIVRLKSHKPEIYKSSKIHQGDKNTD